MPTITELTVLNSDDGFTRAEYEMEDYTYVYGYGFSNGLTVTKVGYVEADEFEEIEKWFRPFFHFTDVPIPVGATITAATFSVRHASSGSDSYSGKTLDVSAEDEDSPARPAESYSPPYDGIDSTLTTAKATWTLGAMVNGTWYASPDISAVIQELVDRGGWASGNDINMFLHNADSSGMLAGMRTIMDQVTSPSWRLLTQKKQKLEKQILRDLLVLSQAVRWEPRSV
jgi:hypothetical protein